jgi:carboxypeptidase Q
MRSLATVLAAASCFSTTIAAQGFQRPTGFAVEDPVLRRIWAIGMDSSELPSLARTLLDSLGPRLTASPGMTAAQDWVVRVYQSWGITGRKEQYGVWRSWRRGPTHVDLIAPRVRSLEAMMLAWSPGTPRGRPVRGSVVLLPDVADSAAFVAWLPQVRGKFVLASFPPPTCRPDASWERWATSATVDSMKARRTAATRAWTDRLARIGYTGHLLHRRLEAAGAVGVFTNTWSTGWGADRIFSANTDRIPVIDIGCEDYGLLARLAGAVVEVSAESQALGDVPVFNVLGEIRGAQLPDEYVMLSAHFDSWDGASGATDNGTGSLAMLEAMRILKLVYPSPRRTILAGLWSGEEQGLNGSRAFVEDHPQIVAGLQALFNQDNGTGRVENLGASGFIDASANLARYLARLPAELTRDLNVSFPGTPAGGGTDHASFVSCGLAPGFGLGSGDWDYGSYTWHTTRDTYDKLSFDDLRHNATLVAMLVYLASEDPDRMPRERRTVFPTQRSGQPGTWPECTKALRKQRPPTDPLAR